MGSLLLRLTVKMLANILLPVDSLQFLSLNKIVFSDHEYGFDWKEDLPSSSYYKLNTEIDSSKFGLTGSRVSTEYANPNWDLERNSASILEI